SLQDPLNPLHPALALSRSPNWSDVVAATGAAPSIEVNHQFVPSSEGAGAPAVMQAASARGRNAGAASFRVMAIRLPDRQRLSTHWSHRRSAQRPRWASTS